MTSTTAARWSTALRNAREKSKTSWKSAHLSLLRVSCAYPVLKDHKRQQKKFLKIQDQQYREAMNVSSYNVGRTVADVSSKTYVHGTSKYLRPDTMWNDDRYLTVTQDEIDAAKVRYNERLRAEGKRLNEPLQQVDTHVDSEYAYTGLEKRHIYAQPIEKH